MTKHEVICDVCGKDITTTGNCEDYRIAISVERIPSRGPAVTLIAIDPPLDEPLHFCSRDCWRIWSEKHL